MALVETPRQLDFTLADLPRTARPRRVWLADPEQFDVAYAINPHMRDDAGALKRVDRARARGQWLALRERFAALGLEVHVVPPLAGHPDPVSLKTLAQGTGLHPSTAHRILSDLVTARFVDRIEPGSYQLGMRLLELGNLVKSPLSVRDAAGAFPRTIINTAEPDRYGIRISDYFV